MTSAEEVKIYEGNTLTGLKRNGTTFCGLMKDCIVGLWKNGEGDGGGLVAIATDSFIR